MQAIINNPDFVVEDMIQGYVKAYKNFMAVSDRNDHVVVYSGEPTPENKVGLVSGGGSGHEPAFLGYVGKNMLDAVAVGEVFSSPPAQMFYDAFIEADHGSGVACLFGNYAGDNMNVKMAVQMAEDDDVTVKYVIANDDVASAPKEEKEKRHGIAGGVFMWKIGGACAASGGTLDDVIAVAQKTVDNTRSICVGLAPCTIPAVGKPNFDIAAGTMEYGIGHHGEPGCKTEKLGTASEIAAELYQTIENDMELKSGEEVAVIVSGLGATPVIQLYILYNEVEKLLAKKNISIDVSFVGNYVTSLDMNGAALTILRLDDELKKYLHMPCISAGVQMA